MGIPEHKTPVEVLSETLKQEHIRIGWTPEVMRAIFKAMTNYADEVKNFNSLPNGSNLPVIKSVCPSCKGEKRFYSEISGFIKCNVCDGTGQTVL